MGASATPDPEPPPRTELDELRDAVARVEETVWKGRGIAGARTEDGVPERLHAEPWVDDQRSGDPTDPRDPTGADRTPS